MNTSLKIISKIILVLLFFTSSVFSQIKVGFLTGQTNFKDVPELNSAFKLLQNGETFSVKTITFKQISESSNVLNDFDLLWFHKPDSLSFSADAINQNVIATINNFVKEGGGLFLTLDAFNYISLLGIETIKPKVNYFKAEDQGYGRKVGLHSLRSHPIFEGLHGGAYIWNGYEDNICRQVGFFRNSVPQNGKVVAIDWAYISLKGNSKLVVEYKEEKGKVLAVGAYTYYAPHNFNKIKLDIFTENCLNYLAGKKSTVKEHYWNYETPEVLRTSFKSKPINIPKSNTWNCNTNSLTISSQIATDNFWDVAGERILIMGKENGGIDEIWTHPFMAFRDYEVGIQFSNEDNVQWLNDRQPQIEVKPESFTRTYKFNKEILKEIITPDVKNPVGIVHYEYSGDYPAKLFIKFKSNLRYMWPYSSTALGSIFYGWDEGLNAFVIKDKSGDFNSIVGSNKIPVQKIFGRFDGFKKGGSTFTGTPTDKLQVAGLFEFNLEMNDNFDITISGTDEGKNETDEFYKIGIMNTEKIYNSTTKYYSDFLKNQLMITTPDKEFNEGYRWALVGTDRFFVNTPGIGRSLVAGYSTTATGWDGAQKVSGRPGYGWYFGRDGQWSGMAVLDYGDFEKVKSELEVYAKFQSPDGKIYHELTTSGVVHYDAADATPLYIILTGHYLRWTGDAEFIKKNWRHIKKAIDYCFSTDIDGDHLINNTLVGHGWVEGGPLYGSQTTFYLAGCWADALSEAANMAESIGYKKDAEYYSDESEIVRDIIDKLFWNEKENFYNYGKLPDGNYNPEETVLPAVPIYFGVTDHTKSQLTVDQYAGNNFSSDWGVRILGESSPFFNPRGYHLGSVWPLFTGWTALSEYKEGNSGQGFSHIMNNLLVYQQWSKGFVEEVLNGEDFQPSGVCPHQCWSETMVIQPILEGMLGLYPDATKNKLTISPQLPADWNSINVENIKIGKSVISFNMKRENGKTIYTFSKTGYRKVNIEFNPSFPQGTKFKDVTLNGKNISFSATSNRRSESLNIKFSLEEKTRLEISCAGGISVLPSIDNPVPGNKSEAFRILSSALNGKIYTVNVEGKPKKSEILKIYSPDDEITEVEGGEILKSENGIYTIKIFFPE
ncbi:MAG TPA: GH116 family glycosyl hydrolase, partial [Ignavibacteriaceae bacterium]|nr:GH116 family glycosyl hydrolase [Ignavibacteriaceae bacterium]